MDDRPVELDYVFDRLGEAHLVQAYRLPVPERRRVTKGIELPVGCTEQRARLGFD